MAMSRPVKPQDLLLGLECPVCQNHFCNPKMLPCGHTMCLSPCLEQIADGQPRLRCPECRAEHDVPEGGVGNFPTNVFAVRLFESPKQAEVVPGCPVCGEIEERSKCLHCGLLVCDACKQSHSIKFRDQLMELVKSLKEDKAPAAIASCDEQRSKAEAAVYSCVDFAIGKVKDASEQAHEIINKETENLISAIEEFRRVDKENIAMWCDDKKDQMNDVMRFCDAEMNDIKRKVPSQSKMAKLMSTLNTKQQAVSHTSASLRRVVRDINVTTDVRPLEEAARSLAKIDVSHVQDIAEQQEACEKMGEDKGNQFAMFKDHQMLRPMSVLLRDTSSVKLCVGSKGTGDINLNEPFDVAVDPDTKDIVIADCENHRIQIFTKDGQPKLRFESPGDQQGEFQCPTGVAITEIYIIFSDFNNHRVTIYTKDGTFVRMFGQEGDGDGEFDGPHGVAVDRYGHIHVCDRDNNRIQVFETNGQYKYQYDSWKFTKNVEPIRISINRYGLIAVTLSTTHVAIINHQLQVLNMFQQAARGISWIDEDHLLLSDHNYHVLKVCTVNGKLVKQFGEPGHCVGQLKHPCGVAVDDEGFVYVACRENHMVQKF